MVRPIFAAVCSELYLEFSQAVFKSEMTTDSDEVKRSMNSMLGFLKCVCVRVCVCLLLSFSLSLSDCVSASVLVCLCACVCVCVRTILKSRARTETRTPWNLRPMRAPSAFCSTQEITWIEWFCHLKARNCFVSFASRNMQMH